MTLPIYSIAQLESYMSALQTAGVLPVLHGHKCEARLVFGARASHVLRMLIYVKPSFLLCHDFANIVEPDFMSSLATRVACLDSCVVLGMLHSAV